MQKKGILLIFLLISSFGFSQNTHLRGQIVEAKTKKPLSFVAILNLNSVDGTTTDNKGLFELVAKANDTLLITHLGFSSIKLKVTNDLLKGNELEISLYEKSEQLKKVIVQSTELIGVLEVDVKQVPKDKFTRIHIDGLPQTYEVGASRSKSFSLPSPLAILTNPVGYVYNLFGKKPKELRKLQKLKKEDNLRKILMGKFDREVLMQYLHMDREELTKLLSNCNYSKYFIEKASDLQMIEAVLNCYENYKALKKGKIQREKLPEKDQ